MDTYKPNIKNRKTVRESRISLETKAENMKNAVIDRKEGIFPRIDNIVIGRQKLRDHG